MALSCVAVGFAGLAHASNPWSSEVGEARNVQRTATEITRRLNDQHPFSPAADVARILDQQSAQLLRVIRDGASWNRVVLSLNQTKAVYCNLTTVVSIDGGTRNDRSLQRSIEAYDRRFNRLEAALIRRYGKLAPPIWSPVHRPPVLVPTVPVPPFHRAPVGRPPVYQISAPHFGVQQFGAQQFGTQQLVNPQFHGEAFPIHGVQNRSAGRQVLSIVLNELANRL
ncbi:hypothetical protein SH449x_005261 [Pirellulaceae bacterium SH449]